MAHARLPPSHHRAGSGTPLVALHGLSASWSVWRPVLDRLQEHHEVFAPTIPGHCGAAALDRQVIVSVATLADAVEGVLDEAGLPTAHLVGNSLGGWLALELARRGRALSVVALSPAGGWRDDRDLRRVVRLIRNGTKLGAPAQRYAGVILRRPRGRRLALRSTMEHGDRVPYPELQAMLQDVAGCTIIEDFLVATGRDGPFGGDMSKVTCPIRIAWGACDRTIPFARYGQPLVDHVSGAEVVSMPGVGHVPMYDDPELVARTILEVTTKVDQQVSA